MRKQLIYKTKALSASLSAFLSASLLACLIIFACSCNKEKSSMKSGDYGVFIGLSPKESDRLKDFKTVVIQADPYDLSSFSHLDISLLKSREQEVYSYLNIGSVEVYRQYYNLLKPYTLDVYQNWEDERWLDITQDYCRKFLIDSLASAMVNSGVDGIFLDNADVYYHYPSEKMYAAINDIISSIKKMGVKVIINGGDTYVSKAIEENDLILFDGINQECVLSRISNYKENIFKEQSEQEKEYYKNYLSLCAQNDIKVYVLEYARNKKVIDKIKTFCTDNEYTFYISANIELNGL